MRGNNRDEEAKDKISFKVFLIKVFGHFFKIVTELCIFKEKGKVNLMY